MTFHKYDKEWDLQLTRTTKVEDRDRLKAVVTPSLADTSRGSDMQSQEQSLSEVNLVLCKY